MFRNDSLLSKISSYVSKLQEFTQSFAEKRKMEEKAILEKEKARCDNFIHHILLIDYAEKLTFIKLREYFNQLKPLKHPTERFRDSPYQGFPENDGKNVFYAILKNNQLKENEISILFEILFYDLKYLEFREKLFSSPAIEFLLHERVKNILFDNYIYHLKFGINFFSEELEQEIWYLLFSTHSAENLKMVTELLKDEFIPLQKFLSFIKKWFETSMETSKVIEAYDHIAKVKTKRSDEDRHTQYYILKMAKQKVLSFELDKKYSPLPETKEEKTEIKNFLDCSFSIFSCFHQTASRKIYEKMQLNRQKALWQYQSEEKKVEKNFYKKHKI